MADAEDLKMVVQKETVQIRKISHEFCGLLKDQEDTVTCLCLAECIPGSLHCTNKEPAASPYQMFCYEGYHVVSDWET